MTTDQIKSHRMIQTLRDEVATLTNQLREQHRVAKLNRERIMELRTDFDRLTLLHTKIRLALDPHPDPTTHSPATQVTDRNA